MNVSIEELSEHLKCSIKQLRSYIKRFSINPSEVIITKNKLSRHFYDLENFQRILKDNQVPTIDNIDIFDKKMVYDFLTHKEIFNVFNQNPYIFLKYTGILNIFEEITSDLCSNEIQKKYLIGAYQIVNPQNV